MTSTLLFVEIIIIGSQTLVWIVLFSVTGQVTSDDLKIVKDISSLAVIVLLSLSYTIGILMDRVADFTFSYWNNLLKKKIIPNPKPNIGTMRFQVDKSNEYLNTFLDYSRARMRICRSASINSILISISIIYYLQKNTEIYLSLENIIAIMSIGTFFCILFAWAWRNITIRHLDLINTTYEKINGKS